MPDHSYTHLTLLVDHSGSMDSMRTEASHGIHALLDEHFRAPGKLTLTLVEFDTSVDTICRLSPQPVPYEVVPAGMTALLDAVGMEITRTGQDLAAMPEWQRPGTVAFVIVTDGEENSSREHDLPTVRDMVARQQDEFRWTFRFLGAGPTAWQGRDLGMAWSSFAPTGSGMTQALFCLNADLSALRGGSGALATFTDGQP